MGPAAACRAFLDALGVRAGLEGQMGTLTLMGIVVNNGIVLLDRRAFVMKIGETRPF